MTAVNLSLYTLVPQTMGQVIAVETVIFALAIFLVIRFVIWLVGDVPSAQGERS